MTVDDAGKVLESFFKVVQRRAEKNPVFTKYAWDELSVCIGEFLEELRKKEEEE